MDNPTLPKRFGGETIGSWTERRERSLADLIKDNDPLVYQQEYLAEFVNWAGVGFFSPDKWLVDDKPVSAPPALRSGVRGDRYRNQNRLRARWHRRGLLRDRQEQPAVEIDNPGLGYSKKSRAVRWSIGFPQYM